MLRLSGIGVVLLKVLVDTTDVTVRSGLLGRADLAQVGVACSILIVSRDRARFVE